MRLILAIMVLCLLTACETVAPVVRKFPDVPASLNKSCAPLKELQKTDKLSEVLINVTDNYALFHECEIQNEMWLKWYRDQKANFDSVK